jgi:anti-sigma factor RsiW
VTSAACTTPIEDQSLLEYWLGELDEAAEARIDEHVLGCADCSERLADIVAMADGIRSAFKHGSVHVFVTDAFVKGAAQHATHVREYRVAPNGSVNCTVAPEDELLVSRLEAPLAGVARIDVISYLNDAQTDVFRDIPFDAASGAIVLTPSVARLRTMPSHRRRFRLVAIDESGERVIGDYTFNHTAHEAT